MLNAMDWIQLLFLLQLLICEMGLEGLIIKINTCHQCHWRQRMNEDLDLFCSAVPGQTPLPSQACWYLGMQWAPMGSENPCPSNSVWVLSCITTATNLHGCPTILLTSMLQDIFPSFGTHKNSKLRDSWTLVNLVYKQRNHLLPWAS